MCIKLHVRRSFRNRESLSLRQFWRMDCRRVIFVCVVNKCFSVLTCALSMTHVLAANPLAFDWSWHVS
ncbi:hypothetical protein Plhal304r1_c008g0034071 [Plasmopara halstedii]